MPARAAPARVRPPLSTVQRGAARFTVITAAGAALGLLLVGGALIRGWAQP